MDLGAGTDAHGGSVAGEAGELQILRSLRHEIATRLAPGADPGAAAMVDQMLGQLILRRTELPRIRREEGAALAGLLGEAAAAGRALGAFDAGLLERIERCLAGSGGSAALGELNAVLEACLDRLFAAAPPDAALRALLRRLIGITRAAQDAEQAAAAAEPVRYNALRAGLRAEVSAERLTGYLRRRLPEHPAIEVLALRELGGGFSKTTLLFDVAGLEAAPVSLVMKRDMAASATMTSAVDDLPVLRAMFAAGLPVPEPLWAEPDPAALDYPFLVMRKVAGEPAGSLWGPSAQCTRQTVADIAATMGRLHALDPAGLELGPAFDARADPRTRMLGEIAGWRALWLRTRLAPDPLLAAALRWLECTMPALPDRLSVVHGDPGFQNMLVQDGRLTALIDWEFSYLGDPVENLCYLRPHVEQIMEWPAFLHIYRAHGGGGYDDAAARYYRVWRAMRFCVCTLLANRAFCTDANPELRMGHCGLLAYRSLLLETAAMLD